MAMAASNSTGYLPASVSFIAQKPGYFGEQEMPGRKQTPQVEVGPKSDSVVLKLTPEGVIAGKVTTTTGLPLEHVPLSLTYLNVREGRRHWESKGIAEHRRRRTFRFANLLPGTYYLGTAPFTPRTESLFYDGATAEDRLSRRVLSGRSGSRFRLAHFS